jgi:hypothetical protein
VKCSIAPTVTSPRAQVEDVPNDLYMSRGHKLNPSYVIPSLDLAVVRQGNQNRQQRGEPNFSDMLIRRISIAITGNHTQHYEH